MAVTSAGAPMPSSSFPRFLSGFVGRERELAALLVRLDDAERRQGTLALVAGEPGIGKTRLVHELALRARGRGWRVLTGRAHEAEGMPPYLPFVEPLRDYARTCPPKVLRRRLGEAAAEVRVLLPEARRAPPDPPARAAVPAG